MLKHRLVIGNTYHFLSTKHRTDIYMIPVRITNNNVIMNIYNKYNNYYLYKDYSMSTQEFLEVAAPFKVKRKQYILSRKISVS